MIPKIAAGGASFKGAFQYYLHDKGADTCERVAWTHTVNLRTHDVTKAWKAMAYTALAQERLKEASGQSRAGRKLEKPAFTFSLAWHPEQSPSPGHMLRTARKAIEVLGLEEHEAVIVAHSDEPQKHVHVIVNRVHPLSGLAGDVRNSKLKLSDFAREYERTHDKIYCRQRETNHQKRQQGEATRYRDPAIVKAWVTTTTGKAFVARLKRQGYTLAQGNKRLVIVDPHGKAHNPARLLNVKAKDMRKRLSDIAITRLPRVQGLAGLERSLEEAAERRREASREAFEHIAATRLRSLQGRQRTEQLDLTQRHDQRLDFTKKHLREFYKLPQQKQALADLHRKIKNAPWWKKLLGLTNKDRTAYVEQAQSCNSALARYRERLTQMGNEHEKALGTMQREHELEYRYLEAVIAEAREAAGHSRAEPRQQDKEHAPDRLTHAFARAQEAAAGKNSEITRDRRMNGSSRSYPSDRTRL